MNLVRKGLCILETDTQTGRHGRQTDGLAVRLTGEETKGQVNRKTHRQTGRQKRSQVSEWWVLGRKNKGVMVGILERK